MEDRLALRPVEEEDLPILEAVTQDPDTVGEHAWFGYFEPGRYRRGWEENRLIGPDGGSLLVVRGTDRLGFVSWRRKTTSPTSYCWNMGIALLPQARGKGYGTEAQRLLARYLFAHTPVHRIDAETETENVAEQKALERAGFTREGVLRGCVFREGAWRDAVTYSLLRTDPPV
ncbi:GNAT family N-acetyltransferase [Actinomadura algeriensis]|uniref:RimJ/RimL family protein N-acetyltransferase n=1 Tax=Actinomadura algeriensis TaxID=1679523 RepID=A0ABR9JL62_9ACTN|nr:GNAT family protein [Actinomadura algeriensis]MBE1531292.1 RimJ/RimL family protein N-acetyltransferase [Actinomadura algeriensis]